MTNPMSPWMRPPPMVPLQIERIKMNTLKFKTTQAQEAYERLMQVAEENKQHMLDYQKENDVAEQIHTLSMYFVAVSDALKVANEIDRQERNLIACIATMVNNDS